MRGWCAGGALVSLPPFAAVTINLDDLWATLDPRSPSADAAGSGDGSPRPEHTRSRGRCGARASEC